MDCPSCARNLETAVSRVEGVQQARVLFATEKVVIWPRPLPDPVTAAVHGRRLPAQGGAQNTARSEPGPRSPQMQRVNNLLTKYWQPPVARQIDGDGGPAEPNQPRSAALYPGHPSGAVAHLPQGVGADQERLPSPSRPHMTVAAVGALFTSVKPPEAAMVLLLFMLGEHLEAYAATFAPAPVTAPDGAGARQGTAHPHHCRGRGTWSLPTSCAPVTSSRNRPGARLTADARLLDPPRRV